MQNVVNVCFIDYIKAFHKVRHEELFEMLGKLDLFRKYIRTIQKSQCEQFTCIRIEKANTCLLTGLIQPLQ